MYPTEYLCTFVRQQCPWTKHVRQAQIYLSHRSPFLVHNKTKYSAKIHHKLLLLASCFWCTCNMKSCISSHANQVGHTLSCLQHGRHRYMCGVPHHTTLQSWCLELSHGPDIVDGSRPRCPLGLTDESCLTPAKHLWVCHCKRVVRPTKYVLKEFPFLCSSMLEARGCCMDLRDEIFHANRHRRSNVV